MQGPRTEINILRAWRLENNWAERARERRGHFIRWRFVTVGGTCIWSRDPQATSSSKKVQRV
eukprot:3472783-Prymnesium_polylepis.1